MVERTSDDDLEAMAAALEASGRYRVLRELAPYAPRTPAPGAVAGFVRPAGACPCAGRRRRVPTCNPHNQPN